MGRFTPNAVKREAGATVERTIAEKNVRPYLDIAPQAAPDPIRQGDIPTRHARMPIATFFADMEVSSDWRFQATNPDYYAGASTVQGRQLPWDARANTAPPVHVAYGSLFTQTGGGGY